ncbi:MAG: hypothetical protein ACOVNO_00225 [Sediminibacterium sp.]
MQLTNEQYQIVSQYCHKSGKYFYDVEIELTDHMVNYIEKRMNNTSEFNNLFEKIKTELNKEIIQQIIEEKSSAIESNLKYQLKNELLQYLSLPKITITFLLVAGVIWLDQNKNIDKVAGSFIHIINMLNLTYAFSKGKSANANIRERRKQLLSMKIVRAYHTIFILPTVFYLFISLGIIFELTTGYHAIYQFSLYMLPVVILLNLAWQQVYINAQLKIRKNYPGAFAQ